MSWDHLRIIVALIKHKYGLGLNDEMVKAGIYLIFVT